MTAIFLCRYSCKYVASGMGENELTEWDDLKNDQNIGLREIDFAGLQVAFDGRYSVVRTDIRREYGEERHNMIVEINGVILNITFTPRGKKYRIISARLANRKERRLYDARRQDS